MRVVTGVVVLLAALGYYVGGQYALAILLGMAGGYLLATVYTPRGQP